LELNAFSQRKRKKSQKNKKKAILYADPVKMQDCSAKLHYFSSISMKDVEGGTLVLALHFQKTDRLFLLSFFYFDGNVAI
jgi:hypothetical protein